ncbi:MAG: cupin domain-containing protein [Pseudohongiella sp.]|nr:cupin domain-containing protein [Pseudohongiella sp.]MDO9520591.1 cupin domain-containing protein [Pseudohongiella sp.]MDP2126734.1 cupin domain-containing protein [Pseudohongiella sp.]
MSTLHKSSMLADLPGHVSACGLPEIFRQLAGNPATGVRIESIVSRGHASPEDFWYDQDQHEWVMVVEGEAVLAVEGQPDVHLRAGEYLNIPAHVRHRVVSTAKDQATVWLAVFY